VTRRRPDAASSSVPSTKAERVEAVGIAPVEATSRASGWRTFAAAAVVSVVTMPITAMWFLLIGGVLLVAGLVATTVRRAPRHGPASLVGLGLLVGPLVYIALALVQ
jgi:hypothetical protein